MTAYLRYEGNTLGDGRIYVQAITNDDNDDGFPDGATAEWDMTLPDRAAFDRQCGKSRTGISGIRVTVTLDGTEL